MASKAWLSSKTLRFLQGKIEIVKQWIAEMSTKEDTSETRIWLARIYGI